MIRARSSVLLGVSVLLGACTSVIDTGVVVGSSEGTTGSAASTTDGTTGRIVGTSGEVGTTSAILDSTSEAGTTAAIGTTAEDTSSTSDTEGSEGPVGSPCGAEQKVCALVLLDDEPAGACGESLDIKGITQQVAPGVYELQDCGACELCGGPTYSIEFFAPMDWAPDPMPLCSRVSVDFAPADDSSFSCAFVGVSIWEDDGIGEDSAPVYIAASIATDVPQGVGGISVAADNVAPEECDESGCCEVEPGDYELSFSGAGIEPVLVLAEKDIVEGVTVFSRPYDFHNVRSHGHKECGKVPHFDWIARR